MTLALSCHRDGLRAAASTLESLSLCDGPSSDGQVVLTVLWSGGALHQMDSQQVMFAVLFGRFLTGCRGQCLWQRGRTRTWLAQTLPASSSFGASTTVLLAGSLSAGRHRKASPGPRAAGNTGRSEPPRAPGRAHRGPMREAFPPAPPQVYLSTSPTPSVAAAWRPWACPVSRQRPPLTHGRDVE